METMAKEPTKTKEASEEKSQAAPQEVPEKKPSLSLRKLLFIGVPVFIVQLVAVYFVLVNFVAPSHGASPSEMKDTAEAAGKAALESEQPVFLLKEILVNPAGTNGTRFLLTSIGFEVSSQEAARELEKKEVQVRDLMNTILTSKTLPELIDYQKREEIRAEIMQKTGTLVKAGTLKKVYFSKFIIQ